MAIATAIHLETGHGIVARGSAATADLFGTNFLAHRDNYDTSPTLAAADPGLRPATYDDALRAFGAGEQGLCTGTIRYPGGTVAEDTLSLSVDDFNDAWRPGDEMMKPGAFLDMCAATDAAMTMVLPAKRFLQPEGAHGSRDAISDMSDIRRYVLTLLDAAADRGVAVDTIELGNEWWAHKDYWNAAEYGRVASRMAVVVHWAIENFRAERGHAIEGWQPPKIAVQLGQCADASRDTAAIFKEFSDFEYKVIDATVMHRYLTGNLSKVDRVQGPYFSQFDLWDDLSRAAGRHPARLDRLVTEWNVCGDNSRESGLRGAGGVVALFAELLEHRIAQANIWAVSQNNMAKLTWDNGIPFGDRNSAGGYFQGLSATGEMYRLMNESLRGTRVLDLSHAVSETQLARTAIEAFAGEDRLVVFASDRTGQGQDVRLDLGAFGWRGGHVWASIIGVAEGENPLSRNPKISVENIAAQGLLGKGGVLAFHLDPWESIRIVQSAKGAAVLLDGQMRADSLAGGSGADRLLGNAGDDTLRGNAGADYLSGGEGDDRLNAGPGHDMLKGGNGDDLLIGNTGNDTLIGGAGRDSVSFLLCTSRAHVDLARHRPQATGAGHDLLQGIEDLQLSPGNDIVFGSAMANLLDLCAGDDRAHGRGGHDTLQGGAGDDRLWGNGGRDRLAGHGGRDMLTGGADADTFCFAAGDGTDRITDFTPGVDRLLFDADGRFDRQDLQIHDTATGLRIGYAGFNAVELDGIALHDLLAQDILFT